MSSNQFQAIPKINSLPNALRREGAVSLELEQGIVIFRASPVIQERINALLEKEKNDILSDEEKKELADYEEIDDYLSLVNRLIRNSVEDSEVNLAA